MGKSRDDNKLKRSSPSSPRGEDEAGKKRHRSKEDDKKRKHQKKHKSDKSSKHRSDKDKKSGGKHKDKIRKKLDRSLKLNIPDISNDDYFSKNNEFAMWLKEERKTFFSDLSSDSARSLFSEFVTEWNNKELEFQYYEGVATAPRSSHKWNIKK